MSTCTYLVNTSGTTSTLTIAGQGSYVTCGEILGFLGTLTARAGKSDLVVDFSRCTGLDSTILGLFSRTALDLGAKCPPGRLIFTNLEGRNLEVVRNLGLHHIVEVAEMRMPVRIENHTALPTSMCDTAGILAAHEALIEADPANEPKFHDVVETLKTRH